LPIFHSEADFQHALAWELHRHLPDSSIRLERLILHLDKPLYLDILVQQGTAQLALELKYKTRALETEVDSEQFKLLNQSAQGIGRYDFIKDVWRLEQITQHTSTSGLAILLTNDSTYWIKPKRSRPVDAAFRLFEERVLRGTLSWGIRASAGTKRGREESLELKGAYPLHWYDYSRPSNERYGHFRCLLVKVDG
jgi:hypothetical protein